jgi:hypothetical protein
MLVFIVCIVNSLARLHAQCGIHSDDVPSQYLPAASIADTGVHHACLMPTVPVAPSDTISCHAF